MQSHMTQRLGKQGRGTTIPGFIFWALMLFSINLLTQQLRAAPLFETQCLFALTPDNRPNCRIPSIIVAPNGDLLVICERRNDGPGDIGNHDIVMKRSGDKGRTWSEEILILDDEDRVCTDITAGLDRDTKTLWLFFLKDKKAVCPSDQHGQRPDVGRAGGDS